MTLSLQWPNLYATAGSRPDPHEAASLMQLQRGFVGAVDITDHLAVAAGRASLDQGRQETAPDALVQMRMMDVDRMP